MGRPKSQTIFWIRGVIAATIVATEYAPKRKKILVASGVAGELPQTLIASDEVHISINELLHEKSKRAQYFLDSRKIPIKCWAVMIDVTLNGSLPSTTSKPCWWDRHPFNGRPIGCPLVYHAQRTDGIDKERIEQKFKNANIPSDTTDFFETEGYFCSFPCCKAYILSQRNNVKYKDSASLLSLAHYIFYGKHTSIPVAPSWKILISYGGHLTIQEFRSTFGKLEYEETVNSRRPYMFCSSQYISEKRINLFRGVRE